MFLQSEDSAVVKTNALKNSIAVKQAMIENRNLGVAFRIKFSVDVNLRFLRRGFRRGRFIRRRFYPLARFRLIHHRPASIRGFHNRWKNLRLSSRNSSNKKSALI